VVLLGVLTLVGHFAMLLCQQGSLQFGDLQQGPTLPYPKRVLVLTLFWTLFLDTIFRHWIRHTFDTKESINEMSRNSQHFDTLYDTKVCQRNVEIILTF